MIDVNWQLELEREHVEQNDQIEQLVTALLSTPPDLDTARNIVRAIDRELPDHLGREEAVMAPWLAKVLPEAREELALLERQHVELFAQATAARYALAGVTPAVDYGVALRFARKFADHLERERRLVERAIASS
ncbi:hemerythrin domain-containing protein [Vulgatibacter sp.]|uniref:hemerythrin domain-containing protein n=1 Tax=Vulgatibacter sp. TaxID=1971226 RepID=UPI003567808E